MITLLSSSNPYIVWDVNAFLNSLGGIRSSIGVAFTFGLVIFLAITGIIAVKNIIQWFLS